MSASAPPRSFLTVAETAAALRVDEKTVRRKIASGEIPDARHALARRPDEPTEHGEGDAGRVRSA